MQWTFLQGSLEILLPVHLHAGVLLMIDDLREKTQVTDCPKPRLILAANSIGDSQDVPARSIISLKEADLLIFEEDRPARAALKAAGLRRPYLKFSEHRSPETLEALRECLKQNKTVCYMSDQGMPNLSDPGKELILEAFKLGARLQVIPGPSSITAALAACPFLDNGYRYCGLLDRKADARNKQLQQLAQEYTPQVIIDVPYRLRALLASCIASHGRNRKALLALDITGPFEEYICATLDRIQKRVTGIDRKLNFVLILAGALPSKPRRQRCKPKR